MLSVALALSAAFGPATAWACRCVSATPAAAFRHADALVLAEIEAASDRDPSARAYGLHVAESWKRQLSGTLTVRSDRTSCLAKLAVGRDYRVYLDADPSGFPTEACAGKMPAEQASPALAALRTLP